MTTPRIHMITLGVRDMARAKAFYEAMGWSAAPYPLQEVTFFQSGDQVLGLYLQDHLNGDTGLKAPAPGGVTLGINTRTRDEVDQIYARALDAGGTSLSEPKVMPWGSYTCYVSDPDGHPWEFSHLEQFLPDENGALILPEAL